MFSTYYYVEHTESHDTHFWVQWLYEDGTGHPDIKDWTATIYLDTSTGIVRTWDSIEADQLVSAFRFHISDSDLFGTAPGAYDSKIEVINTNHPTDPDTMIIARGTINVLTEAPA